MRAIVCERLVDGFSLDGLQFHTDWPEPALQAGTVRIAVKTAALNFPDLLTLQGRYQHKSTLPFIPGLEGAGIITAVGDGVNGEHLGRCVMFGARGTFADSVVVPCADVADIPRDWTWAEAGAFRVAAMTAYHALVHRARLTAGETLLVLGATGGTGHMAVKLGKALGAVVIATGGDDAKLAVVKDLGADVVLSSVGPEFAERIKQAAHGRGVSVVFDPVGGDGFEAALKAASYGARILVVGFAGGAPNVARTNYVLIKGLSILGVRAGEAARHDPGIGHDYRVALPQLAANQDLRPRIAAVLPLAEAGAALAQLAARRAVGKIVLEVEAGVAADKASGNH